MLIVDEDRVSNEAVAQSLRSKGVIVDQINRGNEAFEMARHHDYDVVLTDLTLPDMEGLDLVRRMRAGGLQTPVIIQGASTRPEARVKAFATGADDFLTKPFDYSELFARIQAIVRRSKGHCEPALRCGPVHLNLASQVVSVSGVSVHLTRKEYAILELLVLRKGKIITKEAFLNHLYGGMDEPETKIIDVFMSKLRKKLSEAGATNVIGTVWGQGFIFHAATANPMLATGELPDEKVSPKPVPG